MKRTILTSTFSLFCIISCQNNDLESITDEAVFNQEVNKIEKEWEEGIEKTETLYSPGDTKNEYSMSYEDRLVYFDFLKRNKGVNLDRYTGPTRSATYNESVFGLVLKAANVPCSPYREFVFIMDCEDSRSASYTSGNTGATFVDSNGNVQFFFCIVPVANMTNGLYKKENTFIRYFDTEDSNTNNGYYIDGIKSNSQYLNATNWGITKDNNGNIAFYFLNNNWGSGSTGFGHKTGSNNGIIYTDDEDDDNVNSWHAPFPYGPTGPTELFSECSNNTGLKVHFDF